MLCEHAAVASLTSEISSTSPCQPLLQPTSMNFGSPPPCNKWALAVHMVLVCTMHTIPLTSSQPWPLLRQSAPTHTQSPLFNRLPVPEPQHCYLSSAPASASSSSSVFCLTLLNSFPSNSVARGYCAPLPPQADSLWPVRSTRCECWWNFGGVESLTRLWQPTRWTAATVHKWDPTPRRRDSWPCQTHGPLKKPYKKLNTNKKTAKKTE